MPQPCCGLGGHSGTARVTRTRNSAAWSAGAPLHSSRKRSLEGRRESLYYAPSAREGSTKTQGLMSYQKRVRVTKPCFSNCTIRGTGPSARPRRNAAPPLAMERRLSRRATCDHWPEFPTPPGVGVGKGQSHSFDAPVRERSRSAPRERSPAVTPPSWSCA